MRNLVVPILVGMLLIGTGVSCEKMASEGSSEDLTAALNDLPASYGQLVSVTTSTAYPGWFQLWFTDAAGTIRIVRIQMAQNIVHKQVKTIPRTAGM